MAKKAFKMSNSEQRKLAQLRNRIKKYQEAAETALLCDDWELAQALNVKQVEIVNEYSRTTLQYAEWLRGGMNAAPHIA